MESPKSENILAKDWNSQLKTLAFFGLLLLLSFSVILPIYLNGIPYGNDLTQHYQFAASIDEAIKSGDFYPNWSHNENNGYGGVGLRFYPPISYYVLSFGNILFGNWFDASVLAFTFWMFLGAVGIFFWTKEFFSERASLIAAILYIFVPYHVIELYAAFTYAEFAASGVIPFCFLFVTRVCKNSKSIDVLLLAFSFAVLILTHLPLTVIGSFCLVVFVIFSSQFNLKKIVLCGIGATIGLILTCFHWIKIVSEMSWINHVSDAYSSSGKVIYDFRSNFLLSFPYIYGLDNDINTLWFTDLALVATLLICVPSAIIFLKNADKVFRSKIIPIVVVFCFSFLMMTKISQPIWESFSLLQKVQFPWRWFSIVSIFAVVIAASGLEFCISYWKTPKQSQALLTFLCLAFCVVFTYSQVIRQTTYLDQNEFSERVENVGYIANCDCWLPTWATKDSSKINEKVVIDNRVVSVNLWQRLEKTVTIEAGNEGVARFALLYYPHWHATVNNFPAKILKTNEGVVSIAIGNEFSQVALKFAEPQSIRTAALISKITWILLFIFIFLTLWKTLLKSKT